MQRSVLIWMVVLGAIGIVPAFGDVVINEVMYHARTSDLDAEYVELYNSSDQAVDLTGWRFRDGIDFDFPAGTSIDAKGYLVVCRNDIYARAMYALSGNVRTVGNYAPTKLSNAGEEIGLYDSNDDEVDRVEYSDADPWPDLADGQGSSLELVHPSVDNNSVLYWKASQRPTPGAPNSVLAATVPPSVQEIRRSPQSPTSSDATLVEAVFANGNQLNRVTLTYLVNGAASKTVAMTGQGNVYSVEIPAQANGTVVEYSITASNTENYVVTSPIGLGARYLYKVEDSPAEAGAVVINEIMYNNPSEDGTDKEWVELFNASAQAVDLSYWALKDSNDGHVFRIPQGISIASNGYLLIAKERDAAWTVPAIAGLPFSLNDAGDAARLFDASGRLIAGVEFNDNGEWPKGADGEGGSLELIQSSRPCSEANNWAVSSFGGTPGKANARAISDSNYRDYDIVLNELFYHPEDETYDNNLNKEYIELFNRSDKSVDLSGWYFSNGVEFAFPQGTVIPAGGYLLVCRDASLYPEVSNKVGNFILQLNNAGEVLALTSDFGVVVDYVRFNDKFPWPVRPDGDGVSLELIVPSGDNREAYNWRSGQPSSPGASNAVIVENAPPQISDIEHSPRHPSASISDQETEERFLVEVGDTWRYFEGTEAPPTDWNALDFDDSSWDSGRSGFGYGDGDDNTELPDMRNNYVTVYARKTFNLDSTDGFATLNLSVDYDDGFIAYLNGVEVARFNVSGNPPAYDRSADGNHEAGAAESFDVTSFVENLKVGQNVLAVEGHNTSLSSSDFSLIPSLSTIRVIEQGEDESDALLITAKAEDADGLAEVLLHYQRCSSPFGTGLVFDEWKSTPMFDDGTAGDKVAGDGVYSFRLNYAETLRPMEIWRYRISAKDTTGSEAIMPLPGEKTETRAVFVDDRFDPPTHPTIHLFAERSVLDWLNRNVESDDEQPSLVVIDGDVYDLTNAGGIRYRGHVLRNKPKKSWKIRFPKDNRWKGRRAYNLNANYQTSPLLRGEAGFMEHLAYRFMESVGVPCVDTQAYRVTLNGSYYGLFIGLEQYNEDYLDDHDMPVETEIFKAGIKARRSYMTTEANFAAYADKYESAIGRSDDIQDLIDFIESMHGADDLKAFFEANLDIETYLKYIVSVCVISHVDSTEKNYFPTRGADGRWFVMPWDMSHAWGEIHTNDRFPLISNYSILDGAEGGVFGTNQLRRKFLTVPEFRARYYELLREFVDHVFTREHLDSFFDSYWTYMEPLVYENVQRWNSPGQIDRMIDEMKSYVDARREFILSDEDVRPADTPAAPTDLSPADGTVLSARDVMLGAGVPISAAPITMEWEIQQGSADFYNPLWTRRAEENAPTTQVPATVLGSGATYYWRVRYQTLNGLWSDWSEPSSFGTNNNLALPEVENVVVTPFSKSVRLEWDLPLASDLIRVDIYTDNSIVESTPIDDNRVRIRDLDNGSTYVFTIRTVSADLRISNGVTVQARPMGPVADGNEIAYFRFENNASDSVGLFADGQLLGDASMGSPAASDAVPLTQQANTASLALNGADGSGFQFGSNEPYLDVEESMTLECYGMFMLNSTDPGVLMDRYNESNAAVDGVWRFGVGLSGPGSLDFFLNDGESKTGYSGRLHVAAAAGTVPYDGLFHHFAAVVDLNEQSVVQKVKLYLDGNLQETTVVNDDGVSTYSSFRTDSDIPVTIGARSTQAGTADVIPGRIDEARISAGVLTPQQFLIGPDVTAVSDWALY